jgi:glycosyltransferase involved in cell wall biosynthesis
VWVPAHDQGGRIGRALAMLLFALQTRILPLPLDESYQAVVCSLPHPFTIWAAERAARRFGAKLVVDVRDLWPMTLTALGGVSPRNPFIWAMQRAEDRAYRAADLVIGVTGRAEDYFVAHGMKPGRFLQVPNAADPDPPRSMPLPEAHRAVLEALRARGMFIVGYAGAIGLANALQGLIEAAASIDDPKVCVVLIGRGSHQDELMALAEARGLGQRFVILPPVEKAQVAGFLDAVDVAYQGMRKSALYGYGVSPTKLNDYMLAAKPILYAVDDPDDVVTAAGCGINCGADDIERLSDGLRRMRQMDADSLSAMGQRGRAWAREHRDFGRLSASVLRAL